MKNPFEPFVKLFSENRFLKKITRYARQAGTKTVYMALLLFYAYRRKDTPGWAKNIVMGALGYLISPLDALPDLTPVLGYTDDVGVLAFGLVVISAYIDGEVQSKARTRLKDWFGEVDSPSLDAVDEEYVN